MIYVYPTLLDLCGFAPNPQNEGHSLVSLLENSSAHWPNAVTTTYGRNNHAVRDENVRYIRYEDSSEELYDHRNDNDGWDNLADKDDYSEEKARLIRYLPSVNKPWAPTSRYEYNRYFIEQRIRESEWVHRSANQILSQASARGPCEN
jgi:arylsulfatase A-like enzyme